MQSLQPVLGSWELESVDSVATKPQGLFATKLRQLALLDRVSRVPKATRSHIERLSRSVCEVKSAPARYNRRFSMPGAPRALAFPEIGEEDECETGSVDEAGRSSSTTGKYDGLRFNHSSYGLDLPQDGSITPDSHRILIADDQVRSARGRDGIDLRIFPSPAERTRVYFVRETQTTYETLPSTPPPRRSQGAYRPTWRHPDSPTRP